MEKTVIKPSKKWFDINLKEIIKHKDLIFLLVKRNFVSAYKQTILGPLWAFIQPLLTTFVFTFVFAVETAENVVVGEVTTEDCSSVQYIFHIHSLNSHSAAFIKLNG